MIGNAANHRKAQEEMRMSRNLTPSTKMMAAFGLVRIIALNDMTEKRNP